MNPITHKAHAAAVLAALVVVLSGCAGSTPNSGDESSAGTSQPSGGTTNRAPTISGSPATSATVGQAYSFKPTASDPDKQSITFSIVGKPSWAVFDGATGRLSGTPVEADIGTYANVAISVSDGTASATLQAFSIAVKAPVIGSADLNWSAPAENEDGSALTNLAGYKIRYGTSPGAMSKVLDVANPATTSATIEGLAGGTWYFSVASYTNTGVESVPAGPVYKVIS